MGLTAAGTVRFGLEKAGSLSEKPLYRDPGVRFVRRKTQLESSIRIPANPQIFVGIGRVAGGQPATPCSDAGRRKEGENGTTQRRGAKKRDSTAA
jgi:hypothetical protein